ncbi:MAG: DUF4242 domain-containing protein [Hyphomicrobiaceae bacterium]|nr:MAG: DUF4242 domain-containing protein [Hyphomicrobiaceae bacterium]
MFGSFDAKQLSDAAAKSNEALCQIGARDIQWVESYVADDKTFCVYLATDEAAIRRHSEMSARARVFSVSSRFRRRPRGGLGRRLLLGRGVLARPAHFWC